MLFQWVSAREKFQQAANLMDAEQRMKKSMWGQFWSAHQRFFKYLCIASKVRRVVQLAREEVKNGKVRLDVLCLFRCETNQRVSHNVLLRLPNLFIYFLLFFSVWSLACSQLVKLEHLRLWRKVEANSMISSLLQSESLTSFKYSHKARTRKGKIVCYFLLPFLLGKILVTKVGKLLCLGNAHVLFSVAS